MRRTVPRADHRLRVYDGTTDAVIACIVGLAAFEAVALAALTDITALAALAGWLAFAAVLVAIPYFWERLLGEDEEPSPDVRPWSGIPGI